MDIELFKENGLTNIVDKGKYIEATREDGLQVFFDKGDSDIITFLNNIRLTGTKQEVITAVGMVRGYQIAMSYAERQGVSISSFEMITNSYKKLL